MFVTKRKKFRPPGSGRVAMGPKFFCFWREHFICGRKSKTDNGLQEEMEKMRQHPLTRAERLCAERAPSLSPDRSEEAARILNSWREGALPLIRAKRLCAERAPNLSPDRSEEVARILNS